MKKLVFVVLGLVMACNSSQKAVPEKTVALISDSEPTVYAETITEAELKEQLYEYASDKYQGRETGRPGQKMASEYIQKEYKSMGIPAAKADGDYLQNVPLELNNLPTGTIQINGIEFPNGGDLVTFSMAEENFDSLVYVGYGVEQGNYSDYENVDVKGKLVLMKAGEPMLSDSSYYLSGNGDKSIWSNISEAPDKKMRLAAEKGAIGVIYYDKDNFRRFKGYYSYMKNTAGGKMQIKVNAEAPIRIYVNEKLANSLIPNISEDHTPKIISKDIALSLISKNDEISSENVAAFIKGSTKPNEYVIISSHLDHIGMTPDGDINNGADDDGSGTVALLEIAEAFKKAKESGHGPKRSVVFLHVTGEEKGLLGSQYYTDYEPIFPLAQTVANLNIDMIGRIDPERDGDRNYIYLIGSDKLSTDLHNLSEAINTKYANLELDYKYNDKNDPNRFYYRSDHYNFAKNNIPIIFYFNGTHGDYHRPTDTADKINYDLLENRARLIFHTAWEVANRNQKVVVDKVSK